jgi:protein-S-isoprenylcysteine O-methyltransferase Ste14
MVAILAGIWILPGVHIFTPWLATFDYTLPPWTAWPAIAIFVVSLVLRWRAHKDLGSLWSHTVELSDTHHLVTTGIYGQIRHPLYVSLILWGIAQPVLLQNVLAGWGGPIAVALIWLIRVPAEERMMHERFGAEYAEYARRTGKIIPKAKKQAA